MKRSAVRRRALRSGGFTLIELITVILVLECLLAVAIPAYLSEYDATKLTVANTNTRAILGTLEAGYVRSGGVSYLNVVTTSGTLAPANEASVIADLGGAVPMNPCTKTITSFAWKTLWRRCRMVPS